MTEQLRKWRSASSDEWRAVLHAVGVTGGAARGYEPAFVHDEIEAARKL